VPLLAIAFANKIFGVAIFATRLLVTLQAVLLAVTAVQAEPRARTEWPGLSEKMFELSQKQNVFHIVLDGFQSDVFHEIVTADRPSFDRMLSGFVFFADHAGGFPTTILSLPAMLTGDVYRNQEPRHQHISKQFEQGSIFSALRSHGYQVDVISELVMVLEYDPAVTSYHLPKPYVSYERYKRFAAWQLADVALFRHAPHVLKSAIYNGQQWRLQGLFGQGASRDLLTRQHSPVNGQAILDEFTSRMAVARPQPVYKFLHLGIPHWPVVLNAGCEFIGDVPVTRDTYTGQARCAMARVSRFLDRLRALGLYDDSLIVLSSDHGFALPPRGFTRDRPTLGTEPRSMELSRVAGSAMALLVVKPPHRRGSLQISNAPTAITDIPVTVLDLLGFRDDALPGTPAMQLNDDAKRPRTFADYNLARNEAESHEYFEYLDVFAINGRLLDGDAWKFADTIYAPGVDVERSRGLYGTERNLQGQLFRWSGPDAFFEAPREARGFELTVRSAASMAQVVHVSIDDKPVPPVTLTDHNWKTLRYQLGTAPKASPVRVHLHIDPSWRPSSADARLLGVMTRDLRWTP
jgi:sulfatase-like protein